MTIIDNTQLLVTDVDNTPAEIVYTLTVEGGRGELRLNGSKLDPGDTFTQDDINNNRVVYDHDGKENLTDSFEYTVSDGAGGNIGNTVFNINITLVNDAPVNDVPLAQTTSVNTPLFFSGANGNLISISDEESGVNPVEFTLNATFGTLTLSGTFGLTLQSGGNGTASMTYRGTIVNVNAALDGLRFDPQVAYLGAGASVQIIISDLEAPPLTDDDTVAITVSDTAPVATDDPGTYNATITGLSPVSYWRLGETAGLTAVDSGSSATGAVSLTVMAMVSSSVRGGASRSLVMICTLAGPT